MPALLRGTEVLKSSYSRILGAWHPSPAISRRALHISSPSADALDIVPSDPVPNASGATPGLSIASEFHLPTDIIEDAKFEVIGSPFSLLSVSLSASQNLYTRKGSLVGVGGKVENVYIRTTV